MLRSTVVAPLQRRYVPAGNAGIIAATGTTPHSAVAGCSHLCQAIPQALKRVTGAIEGPLLFITMTRVFVKSYNTHQRTSTLSKYTVPGTAEF